MSRPTFSNIDEYIAAFPEETQAILKKIRKTIQDLLPDAEETISYGIPTFKKYDKYVIYFAGFKGHVSVYPIPPGTKEFEKKIEPYVAGKGTIQFSLDKPIPYDLISEVTTFAKKINEERFGKAE